MGELLEELFALVRRNANAGITHLETNPLLAFRHYRFDIERYSSRIGKLTSITDQVKQNLPDLSNVAPHRAHVVADVDVDYVRVLGRSRLERTHNLPDHRRYIEAFEVERHLARFDLREVQHVIDQR